MKRIIGWLLFALVLFGAAFGGAYYYQQKVNEKLDGEVKSVASASLAGLRAQAKLTPFAASFVAVVTSKQERFGLTAERTMVLPGLVRYELDLAAIQKSDLKWDEATKTLSVALPPLTVSGPEVDMGGIREYGKSGILTALTNAEEVLDEANRKRGQAELLRQAKAEVPMNLARDAARKAIERSFAMPLSAAGLKAQVKATFAKEEGTHH